MTQGHSTLLSTPSVAGGAGVVGSAEKMTQIVKLLARQAAREWLQSGPGEGAAKPKQEN